MSETENMIVLEAVEKVYPGSTAPAVERLDMAVPKGEIVMLIGPSGCGKTTTLKMMNRLIEPTSGRILLDGEDVTDVNGDQLRRKIGYVIQQGGLFPHFSIADNIGVVPKMLGWDKNKIKERADELLHLVGLEPATYRDRYPRQLSGGQQQRVGVARALAADPPVMLMDEPFGAIDPITRDRLQDEFLEIQRTVGKTIAFVTHDLQEAVKLGDRIAVFGTGGKLHQYDDPRERAHRARPTTSCPTSSAAARPCGACRCSSSPASSCTRSRPRSPRWATATAPRSPRSTRRAARCRGATSPTATPPARRW